MDTCGLCSRLVSQKTSILRCYSFGGSSWQRRAIRHCLEFIQCCYRFKSSHKIEGEKFVQIFNLKSKSRSLSVHQSFNSDNYEYTISLIKVFLFEKYQNLIT